MLYGFKSDFILYLVSMKNYVNLKNLKPPTKQMLRSLVIVTLLSVLISDTLYFFATLIDPDLVRIDGYIVSTVVPLIIAPMVSFFIIRSRYRVEVLMNELTIAKDRAEASSRAKDSFLANMSHEMRTPLTHILGFSELLIDEQSGNLTEEQREYLGYILTSARHLLVIVNDILDLARIEAGKIELNSEEIDVVSFLEGILKTFEKTAMDKGVRIIRDIKSIPKLLTADREKLERVLYNILSNSLKFTPSGGKVVISVYASGDERKDSEVHFEIRDTGIGIDTNNLERIFDLFERVENGNVKEYPGTGLGLAISKRLIEKHNGKIWAESPGIGKGSTFHIVLPLKG